MKIFSRPKLQFIFFLFLFIGVFGLPERFWAADIAVRPAGDCPVDGNGSSWSCAASPNGPGARSGFPTSLTRDNTYWLADGVYNRMHIAEDVSGTKWIYVKKATESAHGPSAGWVSAMGDGQAVFSGADVRASDHGFDGGYVEIDGVTGSGTSGYGIVFTTTDAEANLFTVPYYYMGNGGHVILKHAELYNQSYVVDSGGDGIYVVEGGGDFTFQNLYVHDIPRNNFTFSGLSNVTVENCVIKRNHSTAVTHGQGVQADGGTNYTFRGNWFEDIAGTAVIAFLDGIGANWQVYNNVFYQSPTGAGIAHGPFSTNYTGSKLDGLKFYSNTIVNFWNGIASRVYLPGTISNAEIRNNLWYCAGATCLYAWHTTGPGITFSNNWYSNDVPHNDEPRHFGDANNYFVDYANRDFRLNGVSGAQSPLDNGAVLDLLYSRDKDGVSRPQGSAWDIGAYEFGQKGDTTPPSSPTGLMVN